MIKQLIIFFTFLTLHFNIKAQNKEYIKIYPTFKGLNNDTIVDLAWLQQQKCLIIETEAVTQKVAEKSRRTAIVYKSDLINDKSKLNASNYLIKSIDVSGLKCYGGIRNSKFTSACMESECIKSSYIQSLQKGDKVYFDIEVERLDTHKIYTLYLDLIVK